jgi:hypothetical protein
VSRGPEASGTAIGHCEATARFWEGCSGLRWGVASQMPQLFGDCRACVAEPTRPPPRSSLESSSGPWLQQSPVQEHSPRQQQKYIPSVGSTAGVTAAVTPMTWAAMTSRVRKVRQLARMLINQAEGGYTIHGWSLS